MFRIFGRCISSRDKVESSISDNITQYVLKFTKMPLLTTKLHNVSIMVKKLMEKMSALEAGMNVIIKRLWQPGGPGLSGNLVDFEVTALAKQFALSHDALKFEALHLLSMIPTNSM